MKFNCGRTREERQRDRCAKETAWLTANRNWHHWFAWRPVRVASHDCRWLEYIERKGEHRESLYGYYWDWEYRAL